MDVIQIHTRKGYRKNAVVVRTAKGMREKLRGNGPRGAHTGQAAKGQSTASKGE